MFYYIYYIYSFHNDLPCVCLGDLSEARGRYSLLYMHATACIVDVQDYFPSQQKGNYKFTAVVRQNIAALNGIRQQYGRVLLDS